MKVVAGPSEATAAGNVLGQMIGSGSLKSWDDARALSRNSFQPDFYEPDVAQKARWDERAEGQAIDRF